MELLLNKLLLLSLELDVQIGLLILGMVVLIITIIILTIIKKAKK